MAILFFSYNSRTEVIAMLPTNQYLFGSRERNGTQRRTKVGLNACVVAAVVGNKTDFGPR